MKYLKLKFFLQKSHYYDDKKSKNVIITENNDWEMTMSKNNALKVVINGQPLFSFRNNVGKNNDH